jgi:hypothetical protein
MHKIVRGGGDQHSGHEASTNAPGQGSSDACCDPDRYDHPPPNQERPAAGMPPGGRALGVFGL